MPWSLHPYRLELATPYAWAEGTQDHRRGALLHWDDGWGEIAPPPHEPFDVAATRRQAEAAIAAWPGRTPPVSPRVHCGVSTAWWDHHARGRQQSLAASLASAHGLPTPSRHVAVNALVTAGVEGIAQQVAAAQAVGIGVFKIKCSSDRDTDLARVAAVREAAPAATLRLDANRSWDAAWALQHMEALAPFGIDYVEQPLAVADAQGMRRLQSAGLFDVAIDEAATHPAAILEALRGGEASVAILKPQRLGGPDATIEAMHAAADAGGRAVVTNSLESSIGVHAALHVAALLPRPEACGLATSGFLARDVAPAPPVQDGRMAVPDGPGLGVVPDVEALAS